VIFPGVLETGGSLTENGRTNPYFKTAPALLAAIGEAETVRRGSSETARGLKLVSPDPVDQGLLDRRPEFKVQSTDPALDEGTIELVEVQADGSELTLAEAALTRGATRIRPRQPLADGVRLAVRVKDSQGGAAAQFFFTTLDARRRAAVQYAHKNERTQPISCALIFRDAGLYREAASAIALAKTGNNADLAKLAKALAIPAR
jgi:hypothetical protein